MDDNKKVEMTLKEGVIKNKAYTLKPVETPIKLNQNGSPFDIPSEIKDKILSRLKNSNWNIYPDFVPDELYNKISSFYNFKKENILIGNGSNEMVFTILASTLEKGKKVIIPAPTFTVYNLISSNLNATVINILLNEDFTFNIDKIIEESKAEGSVTILCSPNNPTGTYLKKSEIEKIVVNSGGIVVVDEAYIHFGGASVLELINKYSNLIVLRTFSKAFGLAGLRIGIMISSKNLINELSKVKLPYNLNILTIITLDEMFNNINFVTENIKKILIERDYVGKELLKFKGMKITPSQTNFFLVKVDDSQKIFNGLLDGGVLVRDVSSYPMLKNHLRISVGKRNENEILINQLKKII